MTAILICSNADVDMVVVSFGRSWTALIDERLEATYLKKSFDDFATVCAKVPKQEKATYQQPRHRDKAGLDRGGLSGRSGRVDGDERC
jgi:hypothetical protein